MEDVGSFLEVETYPTGHEGKHERLVLAIALERVDHLISRLAGERSHVGQWPEPGQALGDRCNPEGFVCVLGEEQCSVTLGNESVQTFFDFGKLRRLTRRRIEIAHLLQPHDELEHVLDAKGLSFCAELKHALSLGAVVGRSLPGWKLELNLDDVLWRKLSKDIPLASPDLQLSVSIAEPCARDVVNRVNTVLMVDKLHD